MSCKTLQTSNHGVKLGKSESVVHPERSPTYRKGHILGTSPPSADPLQTWALSP